MEGVGGTHCLVNSSVEMRISSTLHVWRAISIFEFLFVLEIPTIVSPIRQAPFLAGRRSVPSVVSEVLRELHRDWNPRHVFHIGIIFGQQLSCVTYIGLFMYGMFFADSPRWLLPLSAWSNELQRVPQPATSGSADCAEQAGSVGRLTHNALCRSLGPVPSRKVVT